MQNILTSAATNRYKTRSFLVAETLSLEEEAMRIASFGITLGNYAKRGYRICADPRLGIEDAPCDQSQLLVCFLTPKCAVHKRKIHDFIWNSSFAESMGEFI